MIGVILIFQRKLKYSDFQSLLDVIKRTNRMHFCIVSDRNSEEITRPFKELVNLTDKVSIIDIKKYGNKSTLLKSAFRYFRSSISLDHIGYFEFKSKTDDQMFRDIITTFNNDNDLLVKIQFLDRISAMERMVHKRMFSIVDLFNVFDITLAQRRFL